MTENGMNILGVVRNGMPGLTGTLQQLRALCDLLPAARVIIATNDNSDGTDDALRQFAADLPSVQIIDLGTLSGRVQERVDRIAYARNAVLQALFAEGPVYPVTIVPDMDGPNAQLDPTDVLAAAARMLSGGWDAAFANQDGPYYDIYALRCPGWCEEDVWQGIHSARKPLFFRKAWRQKLLARMVFDRQYRIPPDTPPIAVESAFGGLGIYETAALEGLEYSARDDRGLPVCEHVNLHNAMRARGARLCIDPALINLTPEEHTGPSSGAPFPLVLAQR